MPDPILAAHILYNYFNIFVFSIYSIATIYELSSEPIVRKLSCLILSILCVLTHLSFIRAPLINSTTVVQILELKLKVIKVVIVKASFQILTISFHGQN